MTILSADLKKRLETIKLIIFDVDGVLTDDTVFISGSDIEFKRFCIADGLGFYMAMKFGIKIALISGRPSPATDTRAKELGVTDVYQAQQPKIDSYNELKAKYGLTDSEIVFVGNDLVDLDVMQQAGIAVAVPGSPISILDTADIVTSKKGGNGAAREFIDLVFESRGIAEENRLD